MTADLGAPTLARLPGLVGSHAASAARHLRHCQGLWPIVHEKFSTEEIWGWCREALVECARYAGDAGVTLALQNHKPLIKDHHDVLRMVEEVDSPHSEGLPRRPAHARPEHGRHSSRRRARSARSRSCRTSAANSSAGPTGRSVVSTSFDGVVRGDTNQYYRDFVRSMRDDRLRRLPQLRALPPVARRSTARRSTSAIADQNAQLAAEFMRDLIDAEPDRRHADQRGPSMSFRRHDPAVAS